MKRLIYCALMVMLAAVFSACHHKSEKEFRRNVILDVDMSVDDMLSILYFLSCPDINIKAITVVNGVSSVDSGTEVVLRLLNLTGHPEIPVGKGAVKPLEGDNSFPLQWRPPVDKPFGLDLPPHSLQSSFPDAASLIAQLITDSNDDITIMALGPMTNIARCMQDHPGLVRNIGQIYVSDGAVDVEGGIYQEWPRINNRVSGWNLWVDARAAGIVFGSGVPLVLVPLDLTALHGKNPLLLSPDLVGRYVHQAKDTLGTCMAKLMHYWLDSYIYQPQSSMVSKGVPVWDLVACMIFRNPEIGTGWELRHLRIEEGGQESAGRIVTTDSGVPNARICLQGNQALMDSLLLLAGGAKR